MQGNSTLFVPRLTIKCRELSPDTYFFSEQHGGIALEVPTFEGVFSKLILREQYANIAFTVNTFAGVFSQLILREQYASITLAVNTLAGVFSKLILRG